MLKRVKDENTKLYNWKLKKLLIWSCNLGQNYELISNFHSLTKGDVFTTNGLLNRDNFSIKSRSGYNEDITSVISKDVVKSWDGLLSNAVDDIAPTITDGSGFQPKVLMTHYLERVVTTSLMV